MRRSSLIAALALAACTRPGGPYPSLAPRAAEAIDPRVPIVKPLNDRPASTELVARLEDLVIEARKGDVAFQPAAEAAERLAGSAGPPQSESWIAAQQALSAAVAARAPTARAMGDVDSISAQMLKSQGGIAPNDLKAIDEAAGIVGEMDQRQSAVIARIQARLGR